MKQLADQSPLCDAGTQSRFVFSFKEVEEQRLIKVHFIVKLIQLGPKKLYSMT